MANPTALILLLIAASAVACASAYTTVVTTTRVREDQCDMEMEQQMPMMQCMKFVESQMRGPYSDSFLRSAVAELGYKEEEQLNKCCSELQEFSSECRCRAAQQMMQEMPQLEMRRMACSLPSRCGMGACACPRMVA